MQSGKEGQRGAEEIAPFSALLTPGFHSVSAKLRVEYSRAHAQYSFWCQPPSLAPEDQFDTCQHLLNLPSRNVADPLGQQGPINGDNLRNISNRIFRKTCVTGREQDIPWRICPVEITG